jgi:hypothetical protein
MELHIAGKTVKITLNFDNYSKIQYRNDFKEFLDYNTKKEKNLEPTNHFSLKKIFHEEFKTIPEKGLATYLEDKYSYEFYVEIVSNFLLKIVNKVLCDSPSVITSDQFEIQVQIIRILRREYYGAYDPEPSDKSHAYLEFGGFWLLNNLFMPWALYKKTDYQLVYKSLVHELYHHVDYIAGAFKYEDELEEKWKLKSKKISNYGTLFLFCVLLEIRAEGFAEFASKKYTRFEINKKKIIEFKENLWILVTKKKKADAENFFNKKLSTEVLITYYIGELMCTIIALYFCKWLKKPPKIIYSGQEFAPENINWLMNNNKLPIVMNIPNEIYSKTLSFVNSAGPIEFLNTYNQACDFFGISYENRALWWREFIKLKNKTTEIYEEERLKKLLKKGYKF